MITCKLPLGSYNFAAGYPSTVCLYDDGVARASAGGPARGLAFSTDGDAVFGYIAPGSGAGFVRMWVESNGFLTDTQPAFSSSPGNLKSSNGRIYSASGQVADPYAPALIGTCAGTSGPQAIDSGAGRAYYLAQRTTNWEIRAFDLATFQSTGTQAVVNVQGTPGSLIRCGANRLAFCTTANQIFIVQSQVVATNSLLPADVGVTQQAFQDFTAPSETLRFVMTITNRGPVAASNIVLAVNPPAPVASVTLQLPQGSSASSGANYLCSLGTLPAGQSLAVTLSAVITNTALYTNLASVSATTPDPDLSDNTALISLQGLYFQRPNTMASFNVACATLVYDPVGQRLFAVLAPQGTTNQMAWFDPQTGLMLGSFPVDIPARSAVITDDAQFLYLTSTSTNLVERVNLHSLGVDFSFTPPSAGAVLASAMIPGQPHALALDYTIGNQRNAAIFDDGVSRSNQVGRNFKSLSVSQDASALYGYDDSIIGVPDVYRMTLSAAGLQPLDNGPNDTPWGANLAMRFSRGLLFFANGNVLDPSTWTEQQAFSLPAWGTGFDLIPSTGQAAFLTASQLGIYTTSTRQLLAQFTLSNLTSSLTSLVWCGADRFAFCSASQIYFLRSSVVPAADVTVRAAFSTNQIMEGGAVNLQVIVSNAGPSAVSGISVTNIVPAGLSVLSATLTNGTVTTNGQIVIGSIATLNVTGAAVLNLVLSANTGVLGWMTNIAEAGASSLPDPIPFNNKATQSLFVMPLMIAGFNFVFDQTKGSNVLEFTLQAAWDSSYVLESSTDLYHWSNILTSPSPQGSQTVEAPYDPEAPAAFYRLRFTTN